MCFRRIAPLLALPLLALAAEARAAADPLVVDVVLEVGDVVVGFETAAELYAPRTNRTGGFSVVGLSSGGTPFIVVDGTPVAGTGLGFDAEQTGEAGGISDLDDFAWIPLNGVNPEIHTSLGPILQLGTNGGLTGDLVDIQRAGMTPAGAVYTWAEDSSGDEAIYATPDGTAGGWISILSVGDPLPDICGATGTNVVTNVSRDGDPSDDAGWALTQATVADCGPLVEVLLRGGPGGPPFTWEAALVEDQDMVGAQFWDNFDTTTINNSGNYLVSGDVTGVAADEVLAYNGAVQLAQDDVVDGIALGGNVRWASINNSGEAVFTWTIPGGEALFAACDASDLTSAHLVLQTDDMVDTDGDGTADVAVTDFNYTNGEGALIELSEDREVFINVDLGGAANGAIIRVPYACCVGDATCGDTDDDGVCEDIDVCLGNDASGDTDGDNVCDDLDACVGDDATGDTDGDGVCDSDDICDGDDATGDTDGDGVCDDIDPCPDDDPDDTDGDGVCDSDDVCDGDDDSGDTDSDGVCDDIDPCPDDNPDDTDGDGVCDSDDICDGDDDSGDSDSDGICDDTDVCEGDNDSGDDDDDGVCNDLDACEGDDATGDSDDDDVCDSDDICDGGDDNVDRDNNGVPDDCDDAGTSTGGDESTSGSDERGDATTSGGDTTTGADGSTTIVAEESTSGADESSDGSSGGSGGVDDGGGGCGCRSNAPGLPATVYALLLPVLFRRKRRE